MRESFELTSHQILTLLQFNSIQLLEDIVPGMYQLTRKIKITPYELKEAEYAFLHFLEGFLNIIFKHLSLEEIYITRFKEGVLDQKCEMIRFFQDNNQLKIEFIILKQASYYLDPSPSSSFKWNELINKIFEMEHLINHHIHLQELFINQIYTSQLYVPKEDL
jgi:hypothetical protein